LFESLETKLKLEKDAVLRIEILAEMGTEARNYNMDLADEIANQIIEESLKADYTLGRGKGLNLKGSVLALQGEYEDAKQALDEAFTLAKKLQNAPLNARINNNFGNLYRDQGDLATALHYYEEALYINQKLGDEVVQRVNLTNIANLWYDLGDYDSALQYALECVAIFDKEANMSRRILIYNTLGNIYFKKE